jgi:hypothetical protein
MTGQQAISVHNIYAAQCFAGNLPALDATAKALGISVEDAQAAVLQAQEMLRNGF